MPRLSRAGRRRRGRPAAPPAPNAARPGPGRRARPRRRAPSAARRGRGVAGARPPRCTASTTSATAVSARASGAEGSGRPSCCRHGRARAGVGEELVGPLRGVLQGLGDRVGPGGHDGEVGRVQRRAGDARAAAAARSRPPAPRCDRVQAPATISPVELSTGVRPSAHRRRARVAARLISTPWRPARARSRAGRGSGPSTARRPSTAASPVGRLRSHHARTR